MHPVNLGWNEFATRTSRNSIAAFTLTCIFIVAFKEWGFGIWWLLVWPVGLFAISLATAPFAALEWHLLKRDSRLAAPLVGIVYSIGAFPASYYGLKQLAHWIYN